MERCDMLPWFKYANNSTILFSEITYFETFMTVEQSQGWMLIRKKGLKSVK